MNLSSIFTKPVDRPIEGVIKADDDQSLRLEVEEYVLTNEIERELEKFLDAYNSYEGANGVWISGFFGSGKSHLLKMLALLLENRDIDNRQVLESFLDKCGDNHILRADIQRAATHPSKSILFNIDQKADVISKTEIDAILSVFVKVLDEACGYYGKQPHIAQFERELDRDGLLETFKKSFEEECGHDWEWGRMRAKRVASDIDKAYTETTGQKSENIMDKYRADHRVSIEDFADQVQSFIEQQPQNFRLNFFVDEVGQYIAGNTKLMTNLQTIAESLATKSRGQAWIIVTAQEDMSSVIGDMDQKDANDFSKIQARFANRVKLTGSNVDEVIQKRLLSKNETGIDLLVDLYHKQSNNFKTLFDFADGSRSYRNYKDRDHFINSYPFVPYQFELFHTAIQNLSDHNAFEGKHTSVGERSMLGVFQEVAVKIKDENVGKLATFDYMFFGIQKVLKSKHQNAINIAKKNLDDPFALRILRALFLVKYVKEFKPTIRNISILMLEHFDEDIASLHARVQDALNLLERQTYIQRNGDLYEFLTDEEKDVEEEIKNTDVETSDVIAELNAIIFSHVVKSPKIRFSENGQDYPFSKKLDDRLIGREYELSVHVITPLHEHADNSSMLQMQNMGKDELLVILPQDERLVRDVLMYKKTEKYIKQNISIAQQESIKKILGDKGFQNGERYADLKRQMQSLLGKAAMYVSGSEVESSGEDPVSRVTKGFEELIRRTYPNLSQLRGIAYNENDIGKCLQQSKDGLFGNDEVAASEAEQEILAFIQSNQRGGLRTTIKSTLDKFERKPYGWSYAAILCNLAYLLGRGKVEARHTDTTKLLEEHDIEKTLRNTHAHVNVALEPQLEFTASQSRRLKEFVEDFFDIPPSSTDAKALALETAKKFDELVHALVPLVSQKAQFPFVVALEPIVEQLKSCTDKSYGWYLTELSKLEDELLDAKENTIDPIVKFIHNSPQKVIYEDAKRFLSEQNANFAYVEGDEKDQMLSILADPACYKSNKMQQLKSLHEGLKEKIKSQVEMEIKKAKEQIDTLKTRLESMPEFAKLSADQTTRLTQPFEDISKSLMTQSLIAVVGDMARRFEDEQYTGLLTQITSMANPPSPTSSEEDTAEAGDKKAKEPAVKYVNSKSIKVPFSKAWLADEDDVESYVKSMKNALLKEIRSGKRVQI